MALAKVQFAPGVNKEGTEYTADAGWFDSDKIRFRQGRVEKIGGWTKYSDQSFLGVCRSLHIFITTGARTTPSAMVGIIMLSESVLGPIWAFIFVSERPSMYGLIGGAIILFAVLIQFYSLLSKNKKSISN